MTQRRNADYQWDAFDPMWYQQYNYADLRDDDKKILELVRNHFLEAKLPDDARGIDVGPGANLYPSLAMLPLCADIMLVDYSASNVGWLRDELDRGYGASWDAFWQVLHEEPRYRSVEDPRSRLRAVARVEQGSVFTLPEAQWDIGTMFFVAESITGERTEFRAAMERFLASLRPGSPFAATFMANSEGYRAGRMLLPAVAVEIEDIAVCLRGLTGQVRLTKVIPSYPPLRDGYDGLILATGWTAEP